MINKNNKFEPLISVIVPIYNGEKFLDKCITSILEQSYQNLELILIDDGSKDNSLKICSEYSKKDKRVNVFTGKNGGVSHARNKGLDVAEGEWITFVDADDCISKTFVESLFCATENNPLAIAASGMARFKNDEDLLETEEENLRRINSFSVEKMTIEQAIYYVQKRDGFSIHYNKLYHSSLLTDIEGNRLRFNESIFYGEDQLFFYSVLVRSNSLCYVQRPLYYHRIMNLASAMNQSWNPKWDTALVAFKQIMEVVETYDNGKEFPPYVACQNEWISMFIRRSKAGIIDQDFQRRMKRIISKRFWYYLMNRETSIKRKIGVLGILIAPNMVARYIRLSGKSME